MKSRIEIRSRQVRQLREVALDLLITLGLNLIFLALTALLLWPLGQTMLSLRLLKGYVVFWTVTVITAVALYLVQRWFRVDSETHVDAYVISNLGHAVILLIGWSAFATLAVHGFVGGIRTWPAVILWIVGAFSSVVAFVVITSFYRGSIYRVINVSVSLFSFAVFALWPASGRAMFGWFLNLF